MNKKCRQILLSVLAVMLSCFPFVEAAAAPSVTECLEGSTEEGCGQQEETSNTSAIGEENSPQSPGLFLSLVKLFLALAFVLGLIYVLLKFVNKRNKKYQKVQMLENLGGISLGAQKSLQIIRIGDKVYVIGVGDNVDMLTEITDEYTKKELLSGDTGANFDPSSILSSFGKRADSKGRDTPHVSAEAFSDTFRKELHSLKRSRNEMITRYKQKDGNKYE